MGRGKEVTKEMIDFYKKWLSLREQLETEKISRRRYTEVMTEEAVPVIENFLKCLKRSEYEWNKRLVEKRRAKKAEDFEFADWFQLQYSDLDQEAHLVDAVLRTEEGLRKCKAPIGAEPAVDEMTEKTLGCIIAGEIMRDAIHTRPYVRNVFLKYCPLSTKLPDRGAEQCHAIFDALMHSPEEAERQLRQVVNPEKDSLEEMKRELEERIEKLREGK